MADLPAQKALIDRLTGELGAPISNAVVARLAGSAGQADRVAALLALLDELEEVSSKAARAAIEALPELDRRAGLSQVIPWLDLGVALAESSGATALKYFKDSPLILGLIEQAEARASILDTPSRQTDGPR